MGNNRTYPVIVNSALTKDETGRLLAVLKKHRKAIGCSLDDIKGINPAFCTHKINLDESAKPVVKKEILRLLDAGMIYPIADSEWVSSVRCVPKKGGLIVVPNENNELIPQ